MNLTLGSLFDGSGGFPLAGLINGIEPRWLAEIEPFPCKVTATRFPRIPNHGDVTKIDGGTIEPVDIITFGSPCQDLSIAGKRIGIHDGNRSSLFFEAIRIIKEMRNATENQFPRFAVWENVPGAFSSNHGQDFRAVLQAFCEIKGGDVPVPEPPKGRWSHSGCIVGDGFSLAWRIYDAQYWGVPQRRKRIYLIADFGSERAPEVLFKSDGLSGYSAESIGAWQRTACRAEDCAGASGGGLTWCVNPQGSSGISVTEDQTGTLVAQDHGHHPAVLQSAGFCTEHSAKARSIGYEEEMSPTLRAGVIPAAMSVQHNPTDGRMKLEQDGKTQTLTGRMGTGGNNVPLVAEPEPVTLKIRCGKEGGGKGALIQQDKSATLATNNDQTLFQPVGFDRYNGDLTGDIAQTLNACAGSSGDNQPMVFEPAYGISKEAYRGGEKANFNFAVNEELASILQATECGAVAKPECRAFSVCAKSSHAMLSDNPKSGFYEAKTSRTLDQGCNNPTCNQGGLCVLSPDPAFSLQGSMIGRADENGPQGDGVNEDVSFTLNTCDKHAVAQPTYSATVGSFMTSSEETAQTLMARDYKDPQIINAPGDEPMYIVRRLTPTECARLQGFPDWWDADVEGSDSARYKMWGNGIALPCASDVLRRICEGVKNGRFEN